jgi:hypothetical protein
MRQARGLAEYNTPIFYAAPRPPLFLGPSFTHLKLITDSSSPLERELAQLRLSLSLVSE